MRLINVSGVDTDDGLKIEEFQNDNIPSYAILSHTWGEEEVTLQEMEETYAIKKGLLGKMSKVHYGEDNAAKKKGYAKIAMTCTTAKRHGWKYAWVDTCCIDKTSSAELSEAINSMYRWYQKAQVCYVFLADVVSLDDFASSRWFTRGWTLQELIAPTEILFYNKYWKILGTKQGLWQRIEDRTQISPLVLLGPEGLEEITIAQRMSWAANRSTTRSEDRAYSLLGLFDINMPLLYGEGEKAFIRLQEELMKAYDDPSILVWASKTEDHGGLLATSPDAFEGMAGISMRIFPNSLRKTSWTLDNKGIHLNMPLLPVGHSGLVLGILGGVYVNQLDDPAVISHRSFGIYLQEISYEGIMFRRVWSDRLELTDDYDYLHANLVVKEVCVPQRRRAAAVRIARQQRAPEVFDPLMSDFESLFRGPWKPTPYARRRLPVSSSGWGVMERFLCAAKIGDEESVRELAIVDPRVVQCSDDHQRTGLSYAAEGGHVKVAWMILVRLMWLGKKPSDECFQGRTPLSYAAGRGHIEVLWLLCNWPGIYLDSADKKGWTAWAYAVREGQVEVIRFLLSQAQVNKFMVDASGRTLLSHAAECGRRDIVELLLKKTSHSYTHLNDRNGLSAIDWAQRNGSESVLQYFAPYSLR
ncbi:ankyrin [Aspergillus ibericus CBS 121593]|uniref:Ankyrin n=1 Tax=Aspergillus ibericus CBS 121593 TaxID=1448316 RepID=A0A395H1U2_9EURO|nr:ankyrin [Aspergillus ibericus CBS 121593]RAL00174.1 ankyrin [Aspergillus ibericus CBS 121593]